MPLASAPALFSKKMLEIDYQTALLVFEALVKEEVIVNVHPLYDSEEIYYIGEVDREKVRELSAN